MLSETSRKQTSKCGMACWTMTMPPSDAVDLPIAYCETNWIVALAFPHHLESLRCWRNGATRGARQVALSQPPNPWGQLHDRRARIRRHGPGDNVHPLAS